MPSQTRKIKKIAQLPTIPELPETNENENLPEKFRHLANRKTMLQKSNSLQEISEEEFEKFFKETGEVWDPKKNLGKSKRKSYRRKNCRKSRKRNNLNAFS